jgi:hypothetical protein
VNGQHYFGATGQQRRVQAICDSIEEEFRARQENQDKSPIRRNDAPLDPDLVPTADELRLRLAEELDYARRMLDAMGDELCADMSVVMRHAVALQAVDIVGQMLGHIANVTRSAAPEQAVEKIGMCELKARLTSRGNA